MKHLALFILLFGLTQSAQATAPKVLVSITPFYGLVAAVMQGVGTPELLIEPGSSPHHYALKPSELIKLRQADLIFWGGPALESFLTKTLQTLPSKSKVVSLNLAPGLKLLPIRQDPVWDQDHHAHDDHSPHDMHFWLNPENAVQLVKYIVTILSEFDPTHQALYLKNGKHLIQRLQTFDRSLKTKLQPIIAKPYIVFHDAYQYFDAHYDLNGVGAIALHPEIPTSVKRLNTVRQKIREAGVTCVFTEPQFQPKIVDSVVKDLNIKVGQLDPLGANLTQTSDDYFILLEQLTDAVVACLE